MFIYNVYILIFDFAFVFFSRSFLVFLSIFRDLFYNIIKFNSYRFETIFRLDSTFSLFYVEFIHLLNF